MMKAKVRQWFVIHGSDYHEYIHGTHAPDVIAKNLGADRSYDVLNLDVEGKIINFSHAIGATTGFYSATPLNKEAMWAGLMGLAGKVPRASMVVRSHVHNFVHLQYGRMQVLTTPGWQLQSPYMREKNYYRWIPDLGSIILEVGEEITVKRLKYAHPITPPVKIK